MPGPGPGAGPGTCWGGWTCCSVPVWGGLDPAWLAEQIVRDRLPVRLQLQLHKLIWGPERRGV